MRKDSIWIYFHSDAVIPDCDCGEREWDIQLPEGWWWTHSAGPGPFSSLEEAMTYAISLTPDHPDVCNDFGARNGGVA